MLNNDNVCMYKEYCATIHKTYCIEYLLRTISSFLFSFLELYNHQTAAPNKTTSMTISKVLNSDPPAAAATASCITSCALSDIFEVICFHNRQGYVVITFNVLDTRSTITGYYTT